MKRVGRLTMGCVLLLIAACQPTATVISGPSLSGRLDVNDVSILFPLPKSQSDLSRLIAIKDIASINGDPVFPKTDFRQIIDLAQSPASKIKTRQIGLPDSIQKFSSWRIAGIRFDSSAPGSSADIRAQFGTRPQIRLVVQPVTEQHDVITVHDFALHIIYDFIAPSSSNKPSADTTAVTAIVSDLLRLKKMAKEGGVDTDGVLSIHPGLAAPHMTTALSREFASFLSSHLTVSRFNSAAIMGLDNGRREPWIFLSMFRRRPVSQLFMALPSPGLDQTATGQTAQMISFLDDPNVLPLPSTTNRKAAPSGKSNAELLLGVSTAVLFNPNVSLDVPAIIGADTAGRPIQDALLTNRDIADWIAHPEKSHFFNTDCVSCHSETTRRAQLDITPGAMAFRPAAGVSGLDPSLIPTDRWNVRNFGWFGSNETITQRTANETAEVVDFINRTMFAH
ncbi:MAG: hypothetical protein ACI9CO_000034 [Candidatus Azotimanducaceae bacterium]|jgi:hypothetical protein